MLSLRSLWSWALVLVVCAPAAALESTPTLRIEAPNELRVGARVTVPVLVDWQQISPDGPGQLVLSAHAEGRALDVVKGRLLRADAVDPNANPLRFELPLMAATSGTALLNVSVLGYRCRVRCEAVRIEASKQILVRDP